MPDLPQFDPQFTEDVLRSGIHPAAKDGLTHHLDNHAGKTIARCRASEASRLSLNWALVNCQGCRRAAQDPIPTGHGRCPVDYRFNLGGQLYTVKGHREIGYGQVGCDVEGPNGVRCWMASEYIHEHGEGT